MKPRNTWSDRDAYDKAALKLAKMFQENFKQFEEGSKEEDFGRGLLRQDQMGTDPELKPPHLAPQRPVR